MRMLNFVVSMRSQYESIVAQETLTKGQSVSKRHIDVLRHKLSVPSLLLFDERHCCYCCCCCCCCDDDNVDCVFDYHSPFSFLTCHCHHYFYTVHCHHRPRKLRGQSMRVRGRYSFSWEVEDNAIRYHRSHVPYVCFGLCRSKLSALFSAKNQIFAIFANQTFHSRSSVVFPAYFHAITHNTPSSTPPPSLGDDE